MVHVICVVGLNLFMSAVNVSVQLIGKGTSDQSLTLTDTDSSEQCALPL